LQLRKKGGGVLLQPQKSGVDFFLRLHTFFPFSYHQSAPHKKKRKKKKEKKGARQNPEVVQDWDHQ